MDVLSEILVKDKFQNIDTLARLLEKEITEVLRSYLVLSSSAIVRYRKNGDEYVFNVEIEAEKIKPTPFI